MDERDEPTHGEGDVMPVKLESIYDLNWKPRTIIEANAGTGKTYTIVGLFLRLLLERELNVDEILVVTFTKKAASELRERILKALRSARAVLSGEAEANDPFLKELYNQTEEKAAAAEVINRAILNFDESLISTIHGFCQMVLSEEALLAGSSFDVEVTRSDRQLEEAVEDFWREYSAANSNSEVGRYKLETLYSFKKRNVDPVHPGTLKKVLNDLFKKPYAAIEGEKLEDVDAYIRDLIDLRNSMRDSWKHEKVFIRKEFTGSDLKNYTENKFLTWSASLEKFLAESPVDSMYQKYLDKFRWSVLCEHPLNKGGTKRPGHCAFFDLADDYAEQVEQTGVVKTTILLEAFVRIKKRRYALKNETDRYSYDDLLIKLREALMKGESAEHLARKLRRAYPVALVDEFQDTDPIQYEIFDRIYPSTGIETSLLMIGDPKQAIYTFRGADVYAYLKAKSELEGEIYNLRDNYRSTEGAIGGVNALFGFRDNPFLDEQIEYHPSGVGNEGLNGRFVRNGEPEPALHFTIYDRFSTNKEDVCFFTIHQTVREIAELLEDRDLQIYDEQQKKLRTVLPGDIAILVSKNRYAERIKKELKNTGLGAVTYSNENVFESFEAVRLRLLMEAVLEPDNSAKAGNALVSGFYGFDGEQIHAMSGDGQVLSGMSESLHKLNETWYNKGFYPMIRRLLFEDRKLHHFSTQPDSERVLTNLFHLADLCSQAEQEYSFSMNELYHWFTDEIRSSDEKDDEKTQLLESDQKLIKILTVHSGKGLEFPVVFCPFLWEGERREKGSEINEYHDESNRLRINVDCRSNSVNEEIARRSLLESVSEGVRKAYVALTRAKYHTRVVWGSHNDSHLSGLAAALTGKKFTEENMTNKLGYKEKEISPKIIIDAVREVQQVNPEYVAVNLIYELQRRREPVSPEHLAEELPEFRAYGGPDRIEPGRRLVSFSSMNHIHGDVSQPDYDQTLDQYVTFLEGETARKKGRDIFSFPKGAVAGTAIHKLFEHEDFEFSKTGETDLIPLAEEVLEQNQIELHWAGTLQTMIRQVAQAEIGELKLDKVSRKDEIREMEFHFPSTGIQIDSVLEIIRSGSDRESPETEIEHYLTGFIDLIVRRDGKFWILDYKSNYLGDSVEDYGREKLRQEIHAANYDVQYHFYTVALKKYLDSRMPDFDYDKHFGGVAYLFVRGMRAGSDSGVWLVKPDQKVVERLEYRLTAAGDRGE